MHVSRGFLSLALLTIVVFSAEVRASNDALIQGAKKEGALVIYTSMTVDQAQKLNDAFKAKYPFIQPSMFRAVGERLLTKIMAEAQAGRYDFDGCNPPRPKLTFSKKETYSRSMCLPK